MSIITVRKTEKGFDIVCDQQSTWGSKKFPKKENTDPGIKVSGKIFETNQMTLGCAGDVAHIGMLQIFCKSHSPKYMTSEDVLEWLMEFKDWCNKKTGILQKDIVIHGIVIKEGKCFTFYDFMDSNEVVNFDAVGSGMWVAIGAMELGATAEQAVSVAIKYDLYCGGNIFKLSIDNDKNKS